MLVSLDQNSPSSTLQSLKEIKHDLIGSSDKKAYFDRGLIEEVVPILCKYGASCQAEWC